MARKRTAVGPSGAARPETPEGSPPPEEQAAEGWKVSLPKPEPDPWSRLWDNLVAIELFKATAFCPQTTARKGMDMEIQVVMNGKRPMGALVKALDHYGRNDPREFFIPAENIKAYQFGDRPMELTIDDNIPKKAALPVENDEEVLGAGPDRPSRAAPTARRRAPQRKRIEEMTDESLEPDETAIEELAEMERKIRLAQAEEEEYEAIVRESDEEVLGDDEDEEEPDAGEQ